MGRFDKDRFQKELAVRYCLARQLVPFVEVVVPSSADLSDSVEVLTDIDVLGIEAFGDGGLRRTIFDCKSTNKMSSVNRAFWAAGVTKYAGCDEAYVILRSKAVHNHRISALSINVDLHDEQSFKDLGRTTDPAFPADSCYQASIDRWNNLNAAFEKNAWANAIFDLTRSAAPLTKTPWVVFRRMLAELRGSRGAIDPDKDQHIAIFLDLLASSFVLWAVFARDIRRFYEPTMDKTAFEKVLRYYLWGGKDSYLIRQQIAEKSSSEPPTVELPSWEALVSFAGMVVSAPQYVLECALVCRELAIRAVSPRNAEFDKGLSQRFKGNSRLRQFSAGLSDYMATAGTLPRDMTKKIQTILFGF